MIDPPFIEPIDLSTQAHRLDRPWAPRIVAELNGQHVKLVRFRGEFDWHHHTLQDELFLVIRGEIHIDYRPADGTERRLRLSEGQLATIPRGVDHRPWSEADADVLLFEPVGTLNTGNVRTARTLEHLDGPATR